MGPLIERCCGLDVHQAEIVACLLVGRPGRKLRAETRRFGVTTAGLLELADWLRAAKCTHVAMESTGIYWQPVYAVLEGLFTLVVANARHVKNVPGRKTDMADCAWIADLLRHGLIRASFVPPRPIRALRDLVRFRSARVEARTAERNRVIKVLESANIKLAGVASDVFGVSGMRMLEALAEGRLAPAEIANLAKGRLRRKLDQLTLALEGSLQPHHRRLLRLQLACLAEAERHIAEIEAEIAVALEPYADEMALLMTIPGIDWANAAAQIGEHGADMSHWPKVETFAAWSGACPGNHESGGKRRKVGARKGNVHLKKVLHNAAVGASRTNGSYLKDKYHRLKARRGASRALGAIAHKIARSVYFVLSRRVPYKDLGADYLDKLDPQRLVRNLTRRLERLGYRVTLQSASP
jgi:transposase